MLILSRKKNQIIKIGHDIEVIVLGYRGRQINLGIKAPKNLKVYRKEIYNEIYSIENIDKFNYLESVFCE